MSEFFSKAVDENSCDAVMETACPIAFFKFQWTVKDFTKYPTQDIISSPVFYPIAKHSCKFELYNLTYETAYLKPELIVHFGCNTKTYITSKLSFSDATGEVFYNIKKELCFDCDVPRDYFEIDEVAQKMLELPVDTVIIKCQMEISQLQISLQACKDTKI